MRDIRDMTNRLCEHERYAVQINTTRGMITIECEKGSKRAAYHYLPIERLDIYYHGTIYDRTQIQEALRRSWIESTEENVKRIEDATKIVQDLAARSFGESPMRTVMLLLKVDYPEHMTQKGVVDTVDALINAGLGDASDTAELPQEEQIVDPTDALLLKISPPRFSGPESTL